MLRRVTTACVLGAVLAAAYAPQVSAFAADYFIWDMDRNHNAGVAIDRALTGSGYSGARDTILPDLATLLQFRTVWICLGIYPDAEPLASHAPEIVTLSTYLADHDSTCVYMEGGDAWYYDAWTSFHDYFRLKSSGVNGFGDLDTVVGQNGTFAHGMVFGYEGDNNSIDRLVIDSVSTSFYVFKNDQPVYGVMVAYKAPDCSYMTIASSCEFAGLQGGPGPGPKEALAESIMAFFCVPKSVFPNDVALIDITAPEELTPPGERVIPACVLKNVGTQTAYNFYVHFKVDPGGYEESTLVAKVNPQASVDISFLTNWSPGVAGSEYDVWAWVDWMYDMRAINDTLHKPVASWDDNWYVRSSWCYRGDSVRADGNIRASEWADANVRDVSDFLGRSFPQPPGMAKLYVMNDSSFLYLGLDAVFDNSNTDLDAWDMYFEDSFNRSWPQWPDSSEGELKFHNHPPPGGPWFSYRPFLSDTFLSSYWVTVEGWCNNAASGHMQYEYIIPLGDTVVGSDTTGRHTCLAADLCDTVGFWMCASDEGQRQVYAWWPTSSITGYGKLDDMGTIILHCGLEKMLELEVVDIVCPPSSVFLGQNLPVTARVRNNGNYPESFLVHAMIGDSTSPVYVDSSTVLDLEPNDIFDPTFMEWNVAGNETTHTICVWLSGLSQPDLNPANNRICKDIEIVREPGIFEDARRRLPSTFTLSQNFPNPFRHTTAIEYAVPQKTLVSLKIFDASGREVRDLVGQDVEPGLYRVHWDGKSRAGKVAPNGIYFLRMRAGSFTSTVKMLAIQ